MIATRKRWIFGLLLAVSFVSVALMWELRPREISGDQLREVVLESDGHAYSSWFLYEVTPQYFYLRFSRPIIPLRYAVSRLDLEINNGDNASAQLGFVFSGQFKLIAERYPGARSQVF